MEIISNGTKPSAAEYDIEKVLFCETLADGSQVKFFRRTRYDKLTGAFVDVVDLNQDGTAYTVVDEANVAVCSAPQIKETTIGRERLSVTDAAAVAWTPVADADYGYFSIVKGCGFVTSDGTAPVEDTVGHLFALGGLGKLCASDSFQAIAAAGEDFQIEITYVQCIEK